MGSTLEEGSYMEKGSMLGAGSVLGKGQRVKSGELWGGSPARKLRDLTEEEKLSFKPMAERYHVLANEHKDLYEQTPYPMDAVWEAEKLGLGKYIGYQLKLKQ
jgi:carbonic anhydrase/acetyltransferase-like protein (isoleucine patch superfamily)